MPWIIGGAILGSSLLGADAAGDAADIQAKGADKSLKLQERMFDETQDNLSPWLNSGQVALSELNTLMGLGGPGGSRISGSGFGSANIESDPRYLQILESLKSEQGFPQMGGNVSPQSLVMQAAKRALAPQRSDAELAAEARKRFLAQFPATDSNAGSSAGVGNDPRFGMLTRPFGMADFQESPAYQFNLEQGRRAIENAASKNKTLYAPQTLQDIGRYSQGVASNEFQNAFSNYNTNLNNIWSRLYAMSGSGQNAAAQLGGFGTTVAGNMGNDITSGAAASAAGRVGSANAISGGVGQGINAYMMNQFLSRNQMPSVGLNSLPSMSGANDIDWSMFA